jgi:hypothetical protein
MLAQCQHKKGDSIVSDTLQDKIRAVLKAHPHYSAARIGEIIGTTQQAVRTICNRHRIFLMNRREVEDALDTARGQEPKGV